MRLQRGNRSSSVLSLQKLGQAAPFGKLRADCATAGEDAEATFWAASLRSADSRGGCPHVS